MTSTVGSPTWLTGRVLPGLLALAATLGATPAQAAGPATPPADLILLGGEIVTMDDDAPRARALAITSGKITAVGDRNDVLRERGPNTEVVDLHGKTVVPGLQDSHIHMRSLGWEANNVADLSLTLTQEDIVREVAAHMRRLRVKPGDWVLGKRWDEDKYAGGMVSRWQLDRVTPRNPVRLDKGPFGVAVNTKVFELMGIRDNDPSTWPSWWLTNPAELTPFDTIVRERRRIRMVDGQTRTLEVPNGVFINGAANLIQAHPPGTEVRYYDGVIPGTFESEVESLRDGAKHLLSFGITAVQNAISEDAGASFREASRRGWLKPLRVANNWEGAFTAEPPAEIGARLDEIVNGGLFGGDRFLRLTGTKWVADDEWLSEPWAIGDEPYYGGPLVDNETRMAQFREAVRRGFSLHTHATGDAGIRQVTDQYMQLIDELRAADPDAAPRWGIEHGFLPAEAKTNVLADMARYGIVASVQPLWRFQHSNYRGIYGPERFARMNPIRSLMRAGVTVAAGSDFYANSVDPWLGIYAMTTREAQNEPLTGVNERIGIHDALRTYTLNGAIYAGDERIRGSLEVGKYADLVVLDIPSIDLLERDPSLLLRMHRRVLWTLVEGQTGYRSNRLGPSQS